MRDNWSMPRSTVIPVLDYPDVADAADWLCRVYGLTLRLSVGGHRAQLTIGEGDIVLCSGPPPAAGRNHSVMVRVEDVDAHHAHAVGYDAMIVSPPADYPYGERQYTSRDLAGHVWTFSQTLADVTPEDWGGILHG